MRDYGKVSPQFWIGRTGKALRGNAETQLLALYLMTSPHANMIGVYHCPIAYMAHETGLTIEGASKGLQRAIEGGFCTYDEASEVVFVHAFARYQLLDGAGDALKAKDNRVAAVLKAASNIPSASLRAAFVAEYASAIPGLEALKPKGLGRGFQGAFCQLEDSAVTGKKLVLDVSLHRVIAFLDAQNPLVLVLQFLVNLEPGHLMHEYDVQSLVIGAEVGAY